MHGELPSAITCTSLWVAGTQGTAPAPFCQTISGMRLSHRGRGGGSGGPPPPEFFLKGGAAVQGQGKGGLWGRGGGDTVSCCEAFFLA